MANSNPILYTSSGTLAGSAVNVLGEFTTGVVTGLRSAGQPGGYLQVVNDSATDILAVIIYFDGNSGALTSDTVTVNPGETYVEKSLVVRRVQLNGPAGVPWRLTAVGRD